MTGNIIVNGKVIPLADFEKLARPSGTAGFVEDKIQIGDGRWNALPFDTIVEESAEHDLVIINPQEHLLSDHFSSYNITYRTDPDDPLNQTMDAIQQRVQERFDQDPQMQALMDKPADEWTMDDRQTYEEFLFKSINAEMSQYDEFKYRTMSDESGVERSMTLNDVFKPGHECDCEHLSAIQGIMAQRLENKIFEGYTDENSLKSAGTYHYTVGQMFDNPAGQEAGATHAFLTSDKTMAVIEATSTNPGRIYGVPVDENYEFSHLTEGVFGSFRFSNGTTEYYGGGDGPVHGYENLANQSIASASGPVTQKLDFGPLTDGVEAFLEMTAQDKGQEAADRAREALSGALANNDIDVNNPEVAISQAVEIISMESYGVPAGEMGGLNTTVASAWIMGEPLNNATLIPSEDPSEARYVTTSYEPVSDAPAVPPQAANPDREGGTGTLLASLGMAGAGAGAGGMGQMDFEALIQEFIQFIEQFFGELGFDTQNGLFSQPQGPEPEVQQSPWQELASSMAASIDPNAPLENRFDSARQQLDDFMNGFARERLPTEDRQNLLSKFDELVADGQLSDADMRLVNETLVEELNSDQETAALVGSNQVRPWNALIDDMVASIDPNAPLETRFDGARQKLDEYMDRFDPERLPVEERQNVLNRFDELVADGQLTAADLRAVNEALTEELNNDNELASSEPEVAQEPDLLTSLAGGVTAASPEAGENVEYSNAVAIPDGDIAKFLNEDGVSGYTFEPDMSEPTQIARDIDAADLTESFKGDSINVRQVNVETIGADGEPSTTTYYELSDGQGNSMVVDGQAFDRSQFSEELVGQLAPVPYQPPAPDAAPELRLSGGPADPNYQDPDVAGRIGPQTPGMGLGVA